MIEAEEDTDIEKTTLDEKNPLQRVDNTTPLGQLITELSLLNKLSDSNLISVTFEADVPDQLL